MSKKTHKNQASTSAVVAQPALAAVPHREDDSCVPLSARDAAQVLQDIQNPPTPNAAAVRAARRFRRRNG